MQRMIRQFAAEYTSKNSSTQDPSQPNCTKNQSQPKASPVQTSPTAATTRNPVLSKLLMADQESPLDLTVNKSQLESKEQDGVLDLSTKKSPSVGCSSLSNSPSSSCTLGNGDETSQIEEVHKESQTTSPLEKFMDKLCTPHQKQFVHVLNYLHTEGQKLPKSENMNTSTCRTCGLQCTDIREEGTFFSEDMVNSSSELHQNQSESYGSRCLCSEHLKVYNIKSPITVDGAKCISTIKEESSDVSISHFGTTKAVATQGCIAISNSPSNAKIVNEILQEQVSVDDHNSDIKKIVEDEGPIQEKTSVRCSFDVKIAHLHSDDCSDSCTGSQKNSLKPLSEETWDSELVINLLKNADKENSLQCNSKASLHQDLEINENNASPKHENPRALGRNKVANRLHHSYEDQFDNSKDNWTSLRKTSNRHARVKVSPATIKAVRNCKRASGVRINDFDNQCDVVYISQPITDFQFENQRSIFSSRKTARKSTRGYSFNGECCELSTVRTLFRSSKTEDIVNCSKIIKEALVFPKQSLSNTVPLIQIAAVENPEHATLEVTPVNVLPGNPCNKDTSDISCIADEPKSQLEPREPSLLNSREAASGPLMALFSLVHDEKNKDDSSPKVQCKVIHLPSIVKDDEDTKLLKRVTSVTEEIQICTDLQNEKVPEVSNRETPIKVKGKECLDSSTVCSKELSNDINSDVVAINPIVVANVEDPAIATPTFSSEVTCGKELVDHGSDFPSLDSYEGNHRESIFDSFLKNTHFVKSTDLRPVDNLHVVSGEECVDLMPAFSSKSSHSEDFVDPRLALSLEGTHEDDLVDSRSAFSSDCSDGEDTADFKLALSLENTPVKDSVDSKVNLSPEDALEEPVETRLALFSEDAHGELSDSRIVSPIEKPTASISASPSNANVSDSRHSSPLNVTTEKNALDSITTTPSTDSSTDNVDSGHTSTYNVRLKETLDSRPISPSLIPSCKKTEGFRCVSLLEDVFGEEVTQPLSASPSNIFNRKEDKCTNPASPSEIIKREEAIHIRYISPSSIAKINECVGSASSQLETGIQKDKHSPKPHTMSKRSAVNAGSSTETDKVTFGEGKQCETLLSNPNLKKIKKVMTTNAKSIQDNRKKSEPLEKCDAAKKVLKKNSKKKKYGKGVVKSDRRLRSRPLQSSADNSSEELTSSSSLQVPYLKIKLSKGHGAKRFQRRVRVHRAKSVHFAIDCYNRTLLENMRDENIDESENSADEHPVITRQAYKNMLAKSTVEGNTGSYGYEPPFTFNHDNPSEALEISVDVNSHERIVTLPINIPTNCIVKEESKSCPINTKDLEAIESKTLVGKSQNKDSSNSSQTFPVTRSGIKSSTSRTFMKHKKLILRNQKFKLASTLEKCCPKKLVFEDTITAKEEKPAQTRMEENASSDNPILNEDLQGNDRGTFMNWFSEEENQERIADFNAKYMKVQKGWILLEKESQPVHKVKNKSDKLKEIWKTKKRVRKCRNSLEVQKLSPVQVLFMKAFKLSDICKWFLETTETKSLVIVKKVNTRLPGDFPMPMIPVQRFPSSIVYPPSAQAERLKKHLKKFAAASPVKINPQNRKLWAKFRDSHEEDESGKSNGSCINTILEVVGDFRNVKSSQSLKTPASARILRKYSNMRGKLRAQHCLLKSEKDIKVQDEDDNKTRRKSVCINPLMSPKLALQVKADASCDQAKGALKVKKGKKRSQEDMLLKSGTHPDKKKKTHNPSSAKETTSSFPKVRQTVKKVISVVEHNDTHTRVPSTRKQSTLDCTSDNSKKPFLKVKNAKVVSKKPAQKENTSILKGKDNKSKSIAKMKNRQPSSVSPKVKGTRDSPGKSQKKCAKTQTRSMKKNVKNAGTLKRKYQKAKTDSVAHTKRRRLDMK